MTGDLYGPDLAGIHHEHFAMVAQGAATELIDRLARAGLTEGTIVDLAAGSGILSRRVLDAGYRAFGVDISDAMLDLARRHAPEATLSCESLWDVQIPPCVAVAAVGEAMNYASSPNVPNLGGLAHRLATLHDALAPGGLLLFDVAGPGRSGPTGSRQVVWEVGRSWIHLDEVEDADHRVLTRRLQTFVPVGDLYRRACEQHTLVLYPPDAVERALLRAGFCVERLATYPDFTELPGWLVFAATRR